MISLLLLLALECPVAVTTPVEVYVKAYYLHEQPQGVRYVYTTPTIIVVNATVTLTDVEGFPVAIRWYMKHLDGDGFRAVKTCGVVPDLIFPLIFEDGFESGTTDGWTMTQGEVR